MKTEIENVSAAAPDTSARPESMMVIDYIGMALWTILCILLLFRIVGHSGIRRHPIYTLLAIVIGILFADFMSGFLHWLFDTFFEEDTPIIGPYLVEPFREHHRDPLAMTRHPFHERIGNSCLAFVPALALIWWFGPVHPQTEFGLFNYLWWMSFTFALTVTNQLHCWAHEPAPPRIARWLQHCGLAVSPGHHRRHHVPPYRYSFCITTGWSNRTADKLSVFAHLETIFVALGVPRTLTKD